MRTASATLGGTKTAITVTSMDTPQFGALITRTITNQGSATTNPAGTIPFVTPGGVVTAAYGGSNFFSNNSQYAGQTGVTELDVSITRSTDTALSTSGGGTVLSFAGPAGLQYSGFGLWSLTTCGNNSTSGCVPLYAGTFAGEQGTGTITVTMPRTGLATYVGGAVGYVVQQVPAGTAGNNVGRFWGTSALNANFATNSITGAITGIQAFSVNNSGNGEVDYGSVNNINLSATISGSNFTGTTSASSTPGTAFNITGATGNLSGGFYGPAAQEVAGVFNLTGTNTSVLGSFGSMQQSSGFSTSVTLSGSQTNGYTGKLNAALFGNVNPILPAVVTGSTWTESGTTVTPAGFVNGQITSQNSTNTGVGAGQTNVFEGNSTILSSTDPAIPTTGQGNFQSFFAVVGLAYTSFGDWSLNASQNGGPTYVGTSAGAQPGKLQTSVMPASGSATYTGGAVGYLLQPAAINSRNAAQFWGTTSLTANFGGNSITGSITSITAYSVNNSNNAQTVLGTVNSMNLSATITGSSFNGTATATTTPGTAFNIAGASGALTGAFFGPAANEVAGVFNVSGGTNQTLLVGSLGAKTPTAPSDIRLKTEILPAGTLPSGLRLFSWRYLGGHHRFTGVMAQDLLANPRFASAIERDADGLMRVNYAKLGFMPADITAMQSEGEAALALYRATRH